MLHFSDTVYVPKRIKPCNEVGVDVGVKSLATQSDGKKYANKKFKAQERERMACYQRKLSSVWGWSNIKFRNAHKTDNTITPSKNAEMWKLKVAKLNRSIANRRDQWQNIVTSDIVNNNSLIAVESLNVKGMLADERLKDMFRYKRQATKFRDQIADAAMFSFLGKLKYKCDRYERKIVEINRYFPSSKVCHVCGHKMDYMGIEIRSWECPSCHSVHDRDTNAAINILVEGLKQVA